MNQMSFPQGWKIDKLDNITKKITDGAHLSPINSSEGEYYYLTAKNVRPGKIDLSNATFVSKQDHDKIFARCNPEKFDVLFTKDGSLGYAAVNEFDFPFSILSSISLLKPDYSKIDPYYLTYFLNSELTLKQIKLKISGMALKRIILKDIKEILISYPDLETQKKIVQKLDNILGQFEKKEKEVIQQIDKFHPKKIIKNYENYLLKLAFDGTLTNEKSKESITDQIQLPLGWELKKLGDNDVCEIIMGQSPPSSSYNKNGDGMPFFQGKKDFGNKYPTPMTWCTSPKKIAKPNDILISVRAPVGSVNFAKEVCCIGRGLAAIKPKITLDYVYYYLKQLEPKISKTKGGMIFNSIGKDFLCNIDIPIPPLETQKKIIQILDKKFLDIQNYKHKIENIGKKHELIKKYIHQLSNSVLNIALSGKLVN